MRLIPAVLSALLVLSLNLRAVAQDSESTPQKQITATLHQMYEAEKRKDLDFVLAHLSEDFTEVAGDGLLYGREDIRREWQNVVLRDYSLSDCVFRMLANNAALLSCKMQVDATFKGQPFPALFRVTTIWTLADGAWKIRFEQGTVISEKK